MAFWKVLSSPHPPCFITRSEGDPAPHKRCSGPRRTHPWRGARGEGATAEGHDKMKTYPARKIRTGRFLGKHRTNFSFLNNSVKSKRITSSAKVERICKRKKAKELRGCSLGRCSTKIDVNLQVLSR